MNATMEKLRYSVETEFHRPSSKGLKVFSEFIELLDGGIIRTVEQINGDWIVNSWVKKGILLGFKIGRLKEVRDARPFSLFDKHTFPLKKLSVKHNVRVVPGGTTIRRGAYIAPTVIVMPPAYINVGAYVAGNSMIDSHALLGSCAYVGERVHVSAATQIGGVLEPIGSLPVIIENDVMIGGNCGIYEGTVIRRRAVIGTGVILNSSTPVYDLVNNTIITRDRNGTIVIPENAVVVAGSRRINGDFAEQFGLSMYTPLIVKYRDEKTDAKTVLEECLR